MTDEQYFQNRLQQLRTLTEKKGSGEKENCDKFAGSESPGFSDPRFKRNETKDTLSTFSLVRGNPALQPERTERTERTENTNSSPKPVEEPLTPQKQFLLLSQTLRRPDGSSNPDIDLVPPAKRSPGSGQSSSDPEEDRSHTTTQPASEKIISVPAPEPVLKKDPGKKRELSNIALLLLRIFGSSRKKSAKKTEDKRSKSCERELELPAPSSAPGKSIKSASSSPLKRTDRRDRTKTDKGSEKQSQKPDRSDTVSINPSTLSLATEWEFQCREQDELNGNHEDEWDGRIQDGWDDRLLQGGVSSFVPADVAYQYSSVLQRQERKSSGYDSFDGENSSLDSGNGNPADRGSDAGGLYGGVYRAVEHNNRSTTLGNRSADRGTRFVEYDVAPLYSELDEITLLKLEIGRHPDILNQNY